MMPDREKVINGMEQFRADLKPFCGNHADWERFDAGLSMLKEQEAVEPIPYHRSDGTIFKYECRQCRTKIFKNDLFCRHCGQAVKWE